MPRNEGFLDPGAGPLASFAWDLRALREKAGKAPYRVMAKRAGFCASTLSVAASGAKLPSLDVTLAYVQACGGEPEVWRERWHALATQHQPVLSPVPDARTGLEIAPPYDADERGEPARLDSAQLGPPPAPDDGRSTDREVPAVAVGVAAADRDDTPVRIVLQQPAPAAPIGSGRLNGGSGRRRGIPVMSVGRVLTAALALATAILGMRVVLPASTGGAPPTATAMQQADALYELIYQSTPSRLDTSGAIWEVDGCRNLSNARSRLRAFARQRHQQIKQLGTLDVSQVPDHARLVAALELAWITSSQTDAAYANIAADLQTGCTSGAIKTDPNYQQADAAAQRAAAAKTEAARLWNANADALGQLQISEAQL